MRFRDDMDRTRLSAASPPRPTIGLPLGLLILLALGLGLGWRLHPALGPALRYIFFGCRGCSQLGCNERNAATSLKTIWAAQLDFRSADRDRNALNDYWRKDIAGLYVLFPATDATRTPIRLIELSIATADDQPRCDVTPYGVASAKAGYWFRALLHEDEETPSPDRFAACAFPDSASSGKWTYILDEKNSLFRKELPKQRGIDRYPADPVKAGWTKLD